MRDFWYWFPSLFYPSFFHSFSTLSSSPLSLCFLLLSTLPPSLFLFLPLTNHEISNGSEYAKRKYPHWYYIAQNLCNKVRGNPVEPTSILVTKKRLKNNVRFFKLLYSHEDVFLPYEEVNRRKISKDLVHDNKEYDANPKKKQIENFKYWKRLLAITTDTNIQYLC